MITTILGVALTFALVWAVGAVVLMIISRLGLGLTVEGFGSAFIASAAITVVSAIIIWLLGVIGIEIGNATWLGALVSLVVSAVILLVSDRFVKGMKVNGFVGAIIAAISYGVITWLFQWLVGLIV